MTNETHISCLTNPWTVLSGTTTTPSIEVLHEGSMGEPR
jgi:hypothetical protein